MVKLKPKRNNDIRTLIARAGVYQWHVAEKMGIRPERLTELLRQELPDEQKKIVIDAIKEAQKEAQAAR